jgi:2-C-methyl-D-erythritol 4-phosphate cytidylyltransferase
MTVAGRCCVLKGDFEQVSVGVIIPAAGKGKRMGAGQSKQFLHLAGEPILIRTLQVFVTHPAVDEIVVAVSQDDWEQTEQLLAAAGLAEKGIRLVTGGAERQHSVYRALKESRSEWVLVHDAVRPFVTHDRIDALLDAVKMHGAAVLAVPLKDTVKEVSDAGVVEGTPDRSRLWAVQTPQAFRRELLLEAHERGQAAGLFATDDAMLVEEMGIDVRVVEGDYTNIKLTTPDDRIVAEAIWKMRGTQDV